MPKVILTALRVPKGFVALGAAAAFLAFAALALSGFPGLSSGLPGKRALPATALAGVQQVPPGVEIGKTAPDFTLENLEGEPVSLSALRGRPVVLYFWATWCSYCTSDLPRLAEVYSRHRSDGLEVLAIDILESKERVARAAADLRLPFPVLLDADARASQLYAVRATPTYVFIDRAGVVRSILIGSPRPGAVEGRMAPILKPLEEPGAP